jgi:heparinase II/III-like protein
MPRSSLDARGGPRRRADISVKLQRVVRMGVAELSCRARHEVSKWLDRRAEPRRSTFKAAFSPELIDRCVEDLAGHFFAGASDPRVPAMLRERFPASGARIIEAADRTLQKRFDLLGYREQSFGDPIDWHLDPVARRRAPLVHWTRLDPLDAAVVGDSKVVWELSRHQWLVRLGQAYRLTRDERYAELFAETIRDWSRANPPGMGINWTSSLEAAFRLISWCWAFSLFRGSAALTPQLRADLVVGIAGHASRIERYLSYYFSPNTHLTGEALGLFYAGTLLPRLPAAARWRRAGAEILIREADGQILADGVYMEQSTSYQRYTAEIYLHFLILAGVNRISVPDGVVHRVESLLDALVTLCRPDGSLPQIGDTDGGWLLPLEARQPGDGSGVFSTAAAIRRRGDYAWAGGGLTPEALWLLGAERVQIFDRLESAPPPRSPSGLLPHGGYAVMRSGWGREADQVILDVGPLGCHFSGGHGHADLLSVQASFGGHPYIVDPGTFRYTGDEGWRSHYRSTAAHSTVDIDGAGQAVPRGPFGWVSRPGARLVDWESTAGRDVAVGEHRAYCRLADPVTHRRTVILTKSRQCIVVDDLDGRAEHRIDLRFQFAPMLLTLDPSLWVRAVRAPTAGLLVHAFATVPLKAAVLEGELDPRQGWVSADYGRHAPAPLLLYSAVARLPLRILTVLIPTDAPAGPLPSVSAITEHGELRGVVLDGGREIRCPEAR